MSYPFGGHPTFQEFVDFAVANGCSLQLVVRNTDDGRAYRVLILSKLNGGSVSVVDPDMKEHLAPSMVTYYQRRLAIKTPFAAQPENPSDGSL